MEMPSSGSEESRDVVARKQHKCIECGKMINKGDKYWMFKACWPSLNGWEIIHTCMKCKNIRKLSDDKYRTGAWDEGAAFGELYEWIKESRR